MKYILGIILVVILIRIDFILDLFDSARDRVSVAPTPVLENESAESRPSTIPMDKDRAVNTSDRENFFNVLGLFARAPDETYRLKAFEILREHPEILKGSGEEAFTQAIFSWRDLLEQESQELVLFLNDLLMVLSGAPRTTVATFYSQILDEKPGFFVRSLAFDADKACTIGILFSNPETLASKLERLQERYDALEKIFLADEFTPAEKRIANVCIETIRLERERLLAPAEEARP